MISIAHGAQCYCSDQKLSSYGHRATQRKRLLGSPLESLRFSFLLVLPLILFSNLNPSSDFSPQSPFLWNVCGQDSGIHNSSICTMGRQMEMPKAFGRIYTHYTAHLSLAKTSHVAVPHRVFVNCSCLSVISGTPLSAQVLQRNGIYPKLGR